VSIRVHSVGGEIKQQLVAVWQSSNTAFE